MQITYLFVVSASGIEGDTLAEESEAVLHTIRLFLYALILAMSSSGLSLWFFLRER